MDRQTFNTLITNADFARQFIDELGWNNPQGQKQLPTITIGGTIYNMTIVAQMSGFQVMTCPTDKLPSMSLCRSIDSQLRRQADNYICIFTLNSTPLHHLWFCPIVTTEKRNPVIVEYSSLQQADFLFSKMQSLYFALGEQTTIVDVKQRVQAAFAVNSERITRDFYRGFRQQHQAFADFISGIDDQLKTKDNRQKQWYTSVMLNRLMFCYFIQKKGFLDQDTDYLANKLRWVQQEQGANHFYQSFYRGFLLRLFHGGLNQPTHDNNFENIYGRIPYLNGGMFDLHQIERDYPDIDICDQAFESLFHFFDQWQWHLDTRLTASGRDINPDVLGYIFEQYINDRAAMGAYYTKEDITDYIAKNCILPFLFDKVKQSPSEKLFRPEGYVWQTMQTSGQRYIYDAVLRGYTPDWQSKIPDYIARGISTTEPDLLERRKRWNERTPETFALPTEIWRETIERLQRCDMLTTKISNGEIHEANDLITYNLNIRLFAQDLIDHADDHLFIKHFYQALQNVSILDPTCGSGAFLFAALNILEPLYEGCIERMRRFNADNPNLFNVELAEIDAKYRSNVQYFIYKSIILRNLYGVDIMAEATEIAKLRLFLKMVAVVDVEPDEPNLGLDPLPDVDFNIRCGNTLVGYAGEKEALNSAAFSDLFAAHEFRDRIEGELNVIADTYKTFKALQLTQEENAEDYKQAKQQLNDRLHSLNDTLNHHLHAATAPSTDYNQWLASHQPFHWIAEFYQIMHDNHGFDVIIGNPPYVEYRKKDKVTKKSVEDQYKLTGYKTIECGNLYAFVLERTYSLINLTNKSGFIVPSASVCTPRMNELFKILSSQGMLWTSIWDERPSKLFEGVDQQLCIHISSNSINKASYITKMAHWTAECRVHIFKNICYLNYNVNDRLAEVVPKCQDEIEVHIVSKIKACQSLLVNLLCNHSDERVYYRNAGGRYWRLVKTFPTLFQSEKANSTSTEKALKVCKGNNKLITSILSSSLFYWYWRVISNCRHLTDREIQNFPIASQIERDKSIAELCNYYEKSLLANKKCVTTQNRRTGTIVQDFYYMKLSKPIIDEIDKVLAKHYGFTDEELDFIINYDIKYRMGDELNADDDE